MQLKYITAFLLLLLNTVVLADSTEISLATLFVAPVTDISISYLGMIFGTISTVLVGGSNVLTSQIFLIFNTGILTCTAMLLFYSLTMSVVNTAQDGNAMGQKVSTWLIVRVVFGMSMLIPQSSGYSLVQVFVMWAVVQGVGFADNIWSQALNTLSAYGGTVVIAPEQGSSGGSSQSSEYTDMNKFATANGVANPYSPVMYSTAPVKNENGATAAMIFYASVCSKAQYLDCIYKNGSSNCSEANYSYWQVSAYSPSGTDENWCFGYSADASAAKCDYSCGSFVFSPSNISGDTQQGSYYAQSLANTITTMAPMVVDQYQTYISTCQGDDTKCDWKAVTGYQSSSQTGCLPTSGSGSDAQSYNSQYVCAPAQMMVSAASSYYSISLADRIESGEADTSWMSDARSYGWAMAGAYYRQMVGGGTPVSLQYNPITLPSYAQQGYNYANGSTTNPLNSFTLNDVNCNGQAYCEIWQALFTDSTGMSCTPSMSCYMKNVNGYFSQLSSMNTSVDDTDNITSCVQVLGIFGIQTCSTTDSSSDNSTLSAYDEFFALMLKYLVKTSNPFTSLGSGYSMVFPETQEGDFTTFPLYVWSLLSYNLSTIAGITLYSDSSTSTLFSDWMSNVAPVNPGCTSALNSDSCKTSPYDGCYSYGVSSGCINTSSYTGLLGGVAAASNSTMVDPIMSLATVGAAFINTATSYWEQNIDQGYKTMKQLSLDYSLVNMAIGVGASAAAFAMTFATAGYDVGGAFAIISGTLQGMMAWFFSMDKILIESYMPLGSALAAVFFGLGVVLAIYIPFVPFLLFLFGVISWMIAVVEAMVAAPLVALGVTHPEGHDLLGKAEQSVMLLLGVFIRPATMIFGLIFAIILNYIAFSLFNLGYVYTVNPILSNLDSSGSTFQLIVISGTLFIYTYVAIEIVNQCFSMIYVVPDKILRWIGGPQEQSNIGQMMGQIKGGVSQAAGSAGESAKGKSSGAPQVSPSQGATDTSMKKDKGSTGESSAET